MLRSVVAACEGVNGLHEKDIQHRLHISCTQAREERGERREERGERRVSTKKVK